MWELRQDSFDFGIDDCNPNLHSNVVLYSARNFRPSQELPRYDPEGADVTLDFLVMLPFFSEKDFIAIIYHIAPSRTSIAKEFSSARIVSKTPTKSIIIGFDSSLRSRAKE